MPTFDILVVGEINPDLILTGAVEPAFGQVEQLVETATLTIGSSSVIFACGAARLGLSVAFVGLCGDDVFGRFMLQQMRLRKVDTGHVIVTGKAATALSVILNRGVDRAILTYPGLIPMLKSEDVPDSLLRQVRHVHVASYFLQTGLQAGLPGLFERAHAVGLSTSLDTNYDPSEQWSGFDRLLALTDVFLPNEKEACSIAGVESMALAVDNLAGRVGSLAVKLGAAGAVGARQAQRARAPSLTVKVVDTVGAGDNFDAGFLYGFLNGWSLEQSLRLGVVCGALSTQAVGGTTAQPTLAEAIKYL
jgi:sugar/nucleoside kinase (ribokinase family)